MQKTMTINRVLCAVLTIMLMLALVPTYAFADTTAEPTDLQLACKNKTNEEFIDFMIAHNTDVVCPIDCKNDDGYTYFTEDLKDYFLNDYFVNNKKPWYEVTWGTGYNPCIENQCYVSFYDTVDSLPVDSPFIQWLLDDSNVSSDNSTITIETEASTINVTVPTNAAFIFKSDGTNIYPSNYEVTNNNGLTAITLDAIDFEGVNGWSLTDEDDTFQADVKKFALKMGLKGNALSIVDKDNGVSFAGDTEIKITPQSSKTLGFEAVRGVFSSPVTTESAMQMTMHFDWEHAA